MKRQFCTPDAIFVNEMHRLYTKRDLFNLPFFVYDSFDRHAKGRSTPSRFFCNRRIHHFFGQYG